MVRLLRARQSPRQDRFRESLDCLKCRRAKRRRTQPVGRIWPVRGTDFSSARRQRSPRPPDMQCADLPVPNRLFPPRIRRNKGNWQINLDQGFGVGRGHYSWQSQSDFISYIEAQSIAKPALSVQLDSARNRIRRRPSHDLLNSIAKGNGCPEVPITPLHQGNVLPSVRVDDRRSGFEPVGISVF